MWLFGKKIKNISSGSHVLYTTSNLVNSRRCQDEDGEEMHQNVKPREVTLFLFIKPIVLYRFRSRRRRPIIRSLLLIQYDVMM